MATVYYPPTCVCGEPLNDPQAIHLGFCSKRCATNSTWNNPKIRLNGPLSSMAPSATKGRHLSAEELAKLAGEGGNDLSSLGRAVDSVEKAVQGYHDMVKMADSNIAHEMLGRPVDAPKRKTCACCPKPVNTSNPHAVFCSGGCAEKAAEMYKSRPRTTVINTPPQMFVAAERALGFIAGLNLQDHSVKEQRESLDVVRALQTALRPERVKFEGTMGRLRDEEARQKSVREEKDREKKARFLQNLTKPICFGTK